jgi:hypothetical protein
MQTPVRRRAMTRKALIALTAAAALGVSSAALAAGQHGGGNMGGMSHGGGNMGGMSHGPAMSGMSHGPAMSGMSHGPAMSGKPGWGSPTMKSTYGKGPGWGATNTSKNGIKSGQKLTSKNGIKSGQKLTSKNGIKSGQKLTSKNGIKSGQKLTGKPGQASTNIKNGINTSKIKAPVLTGKTKSVIIFRNHHHRRVFVDIAFFGVFADFPSCWQWTWTPWGWQRVFVCDVPPWAWG